MEAKLDRRLLKVLFYVSKKGYPVKNYFMIKRLVLIGKLGLLLEFIFGYE